jgi:exodeoxyribonuclease-5
MSSLCVVCRHEIAGYATTTWGGGDAHHHCAERAFRAVHRPRVALTSQQLEAVEAAEAAIAAGEHFSLQGLAGTGKTTVLAEIAARHPYAHLCAPTGKAASVLAAKTGIRATTIHKVFYRLTDTVEREGDTPRLVFKAIREPGAFRGQTLLIDESSMVGRKVAADILRTGVTLVAVGDPGQLPPVEGRPFFTEAVFKRSFVLTEIHRQALENPIIRQAHAVRVGKPYEADGEAVRVIDQLSDEELIAADVVLAGRRPTRMQLNAERRRILGFSNPLPRLREPLICLRNLPKYGLCNGAVYFASRDLQEGDKTIGISTDDGDLEVPGVFLPAGHEYDRPDLPVWMCSFAFGYALTTHLAQGSEWDKVLLVDESAVFGDDRNRWLYTGTTRAKNKLVIARSLPPTGSGAVS